MNTSTVSTFVSDGESLSISSFATIEARFSTFISTLEAGQDGTCVG